MNKFKTPKITFWKVVFWVLIILGLYGVGVRFYGGLGAATNMTDELPWGLWVGFDILCGVGLAAGGFTVSAIVYIFGIEKFRPIVRPALLTAFLGYLLVITGLLIDLGRPWRIWHALVMWNHHSIMFEVAWCVMLYTTVLAFEFSHIVFERLSWDRALRFTKAAMIPLVILGVILSTLHQSSLGSLYLIIPQKLSPLWYTPQLPVLFFISAVMVGFAMVIVESNLSARAFGRKLELQLLVQIGRILLVAIAVYGLFRIQDLFYREAWPSLFPFDLVSGLFVAELATGIFIPLVMLAIPVVRRNPVGLYISALLTLFGFVLMRLNVALTGLKSLNGVQYVPSWMELAVTVSIVAAGFGIFSLAVKHLNIFEDVRIGEPSKV